MVITRVLTLDVTNTIVKVRGSVGCIYNNVATQLGLQHVSAVPIRTINSRFRESFQRYWAKHTNFGYGNMAAKHWWDGVTLETLNSVTQNSLSQSDSTAFCDALYEAFADSTSYQLTPGAADTLEKVNQAGVDIIVITNNDTRIRCVIEKLFSPDLFQRIVISNEQGCFKPDKNIFLQALKDIDVPLDRVLHVGDSYTKDYEPATRLGMGALLLTQPQPPQHEYPNLKYPPNTRTISDISQLLQHL